MFVNERYTKITYFCLVRKIYQSLNFIYLLTLLSFKRYNHLISYTALNILDYSYIKIIPNISVDSNRQSGERQAAFTRAVSRRTIRERCSRSRAVRHRQHVGRYRQQARQA